MDNKNVIIIILAIVLVVIAVGCLYFVADFGLAGFADYFGFGYSAGFADFADYPGSVGLDFGCCRRGQVSLVLLLIQQGFFLSVFGRLRTLPLLPDRFSVSLFQGLNLRFLRSLSSFAQAQILCPAEVSC